MKIVVIEERPAAAPALARELGRSGYQVEAVASAGVAVERAAAPDVSLMVLDLAGDRAADVLRRLAELNVQVPVVVVADREAVEGQEALDRWAPDVVTKPASRGDLVTRVRVALARPERPRRVLRSGRIRLALATGRVTVGRRPVHLTARELALLRELMADPGRIHSREELLSRVWGIDFHARTNVVGVYVGYLRRKLGRESIETVRGAGYRMPE